MRRIGWAIILLSCSTRAESRLPRESRLTVTLAASFEAPYANGVVAEMKRELASLWRGADLNFLWVTADDEHRPERGYVVRLEFRGACDFSSTAIQFLQPTTLAVTRTVGAEVLPHTIVNCDRVRVNLSAAPAPETVSGRDRLLGRALARVLSHELYHVLAASTQHLGVGLAKPNLSIADLTEPGLQCDREMLRIISRRLGLPGASSD
jgi:hypothetical protein